MTRIVRTPRRALHASHVVVLASALTLALAGCSSPPRVGVNGTGGGSTPTSAATAGGGGGTDVLGQPLTAVDVPTWADAAMPAGTDASLVAPCGKPTGAREQQSAVRAAALVTPTQITVLTQVADYDGGDPISTVNATIASALAGCPMSATDTQDVLVRRLKSSTSTPMTGVEVVSTDRDTGLRDVTVYWAAVTGKGTVEVAVSGRMGAVGISPLEPFALKVLTAAQLHSQGKAFDVLSAPALPELLTREQYVVPTEGVGVTTDGPPDSSSSTAGPITADPSVQDYRWQYDQNPIPDTGAGGETGPHTQSGTIVE